MAIFTGLKKGVLEQLLSEKQLLKAQRIDLAVQEYFESHPKAETLLPHELMPSLMDKGIYYKADPEGRQLSYFLSKLEKWHLLNLFRHPAAKTIDKGWYFHK